MHRSNGHAVIFQREGNILSHRQADKLPIGILQNRTDCLGKLEQSLFLGVFTANGQAAGRFSGIGIGHIPISMDATIIFFFQVDALDFRGEARQFIEAFFQGLEVLDGRMGPAFARDDAEDAWRIGQGPFQGNAAFDFIERYQFSLPFRLSLYLLY